MRAVESITLALALVLGTGCRVTGEFHCEANGQCVGQGAAPGVCVTGSCAFDDPGCTSGWRFADSAADEIAGACLEGVPPADCAAWMPKHFSPCALPAPLGEVRLSEGGYVYDTDRGEFVGGPAVVHTSIVLPQTDGTQLRIISVSAFTIDAQIRLRVVGSLPLVIASWGKIDIAGQIEVSSSVNDLRGAGANFAGCKAAKQGEAGLASKGSAGGGGGGFTGAGGTGGDADREAPPGRLGGGGAATLAMPTTIVHGGCPGAPGGAIGPAAKPPSTPTSASLPGAGGGALQLTARGAITISGIVDAGGAGGGGGAGTVEGGGGGGGSGGFLGLEAPSVTVTGVVAANGGGGGGGANDGTAGVAGSDGRAASSAAPGGNAGANCASGGANGSAGTTLAGASIDPAQPPSSCGAGGGGGGAGVISIRSPAFTMTGATLSPPVTIDP